MGKYDDFEIGSPDAAERAYKELEEGKFGYSTYLDYIKPDIPLYKPKEGDNFIRILPPLKCPLNSWFRANVFYHRLPNGDRVLCMKATFGANNNCLICDFRKSLWDSDPELARSLRPIRRSLMWVVDAENEETLAEGVKLFPAPGEKVGDAILVAIREKRTGKIIDVVDPEKGCVISFSMKKNTIAVGGRVVPMGEYYNVQAEKDDVVPAKKEWLDQIRSYGTFEDVLVKPDEDAVKQLIVNLKAFSEPVGEEPIEEPPTEESPAEDDLPSCFGSEFDYASEKCLNCSRFVDCAKASAVKRKGNLKEKLAEALEE